MAAARYVSVARGLAVLAVAVSLVALLARLPQESEQVSAGSAPRACRTPIAVATALGERLACAGEVDLGRCVGLGAGDRVRLTERGCEVERGGMGAAVRLLVGLKVDVNRATAAELELLDGIGPRLAAEIVRVRAQRGAFRSFAELGDVRGIGPALLGKLERQIELAPR